MTLTPTTAAQLRRLSELTGSSQASLISELLEGQELVFAKLIHVLEAAHLAKGQMIEGLKEDMEKAQAQIEGQLGLVLDHFDDGFAPLVAEAEKIRRRAGLRKRRRTGCLRSARCGPAPRAGRDMPFARASGFATGCVFCPGRCLSPARRI